MKPVMIFAGTTEGRRLAERLADAQIPCIVCVATEYGKMVMPEREWIKIHKGRLSREQMEALMEENGISVVVDATHPFAQEVTENIKKVARVPYLRLLRSEKQCAQWEEPLFKDNKLHVCQNTDDCIEQLQKTEGNILLTTGSKELKNFCSACGLKERLFVRVLPGRESIEICESLGLLGKQIIAMQGPFSKQMNEAILEEYQISQIVTKESGETGGYPEKLQAAMEKKAEVFVIRKPHEEGIDFEETIRQLEKLLDFPIEKKETAETPTLQISMIGVGMGRELGMTREAQIALEKAQYVFGAQRLLAQIPKTQNPNPNYLPEKILPELEKIQKTGGNVALLFSGDSGFYSGAGKMYAALTEAGYKNVRIYAGISCISALAAECGIPWQDAHILSVHGGGDVEVWGAKVLDSVRYHAKTFLLFSGVEQVNRLGRLLIEEQMEDCIVTLGYQLSYPEQKVKNISPKECTALTKEGLYAAFIQNKRAMERRVGCHLKDEEFQRDRVPMTKEEVRHVAIDKMGLSKDSVVYDIGSGTGSIAIEAAGLHGRIAVYAIEKKSLAVELIEKNCKLHHARNVRIVEGKAPEALANLPAPTHVFIGGSGGDLEEILSVLYQKNPKVRVVISAISIETIAKLAKLEEKFKFSEFEMIQIQVSRAKKTGDYHLMQGENPVYLVTLQFSERG